jgi:hypothetical protein
VPGQDVAHRDHPPVETGGWNIGKSAFADCGVEIRPFLSNRDEAAVEVREGGAKADSVPS